MADVRLLMPWRELANRAAGRGFSVTTGSGDCFEHKAEKRLRMHKRTTQILITATLCLASGLGKCAEPSYQGKALSKWLLELHEKPSEEEVSKELRKLGQFEPDAEERIYEEKRKRDEDAIRRMGQSAVPTLLEMLGATSGNFLKVVRKLKAAEFHEEWWNEESRVDDLRSLAVDGFEVLGTNASSAVPQLTKLLHGAETSFDAARALTMVGPKGIAALTNALSKPDDPARNAAIWWLRKAPIDDETKDRLLVQRLNDTDDVNRHNAAQFLAGRYPAAIPALIKMLDEDTNYLAVSGAADALANFGTAAKDAVPKLLFIYTNHVVVRDRVEAGSWAGAVMAALKAIDMAAAAKAETFLVSSGPLNIARTGHTVTLLTNGQELIAGGSVHREIGGIVNQTLASAQLNNPLTGKWNETGALNTPRSSHTATQLRNGKVLIAGGMDGNGHALASCELYDPATGKWVGAAPLKTARYYHTAGLQADGRVMVANGHTGGKPLNDVEFYDPATDQWTAGPAVTSLLPAVRQLHSATLLQNGKVLIAGGQGPTGFLSTAELYDPGTDSWTNSGAMKVARIAHQTIQLSNGKVLVIGGAAPDESDHRAELFDPSTGEWESADVPLPNHDVFSATMLQNGRVLITGVENVGKRSSFAELYDPAKDEWSATAALPHGREGYATTRLSSGKVLVAGGRLGTGGTWSILADCEIYDPVTKKWNATGPMNVARWRHTATLLANGKVLVAGGSGAWLEPLSSAELYDPKTGRWALTGTLHNERYDHTATVLPTGEVLVVGSYENDGDALSTAEIYDPTTGKWPVLLRLNGGHSGHTATLLPNGKVLVVGGNAVSRVEICDPRPAR